MPDYELYNILLSEGYIPNKKNLEIAKILLEDDDVEGTYRDGQIKAVVKRKKRETDPRKIEGASVSDYEREGRGTGLKSDNKIVQAAKVVAKGILGAAAGMGAASVGDSLGSKALGSTAAKIASASVGGAAGAGVGIKQEINRSPLSVAKSKAGTPSKGKTKCITVGSGDNKKTIYLIAKIKNGKYVWDKSTPDEAQKAKNEEADAAEAAEAERKKNNGEQQPEPKK